MCTFSSSILLYHCFFLLINVHCFKVLAWYDPWIQVTITYEDGSPMEAKGVFRKILEKVQETYRTDLGSKYFAYDGQKNLFTIGALPSNKMDFLVVLENTPSSRSSLVLKHIYHVVIKFKMS